VSAKRYAALTLAVLLAACASEPPQDVHLARSVLTAGDPNDRFNRVDQVSFKHSDTVHLFDIVQWGDTLNDAGKRIVKWTWYNEDRQVTSTESKLYFFASPYELQAQLPASALEPGPHHRVEVLIDGNLLDQRDFEVLPDAAPANPAP
jgi:hypothetical protein